MLKIRLSRTGKKNQPTYRVVVTKHTAPPKCGYIEHIGHYNPRTKEFEIDKEKLNDWQNKGAKLSNTVNNLLVRKKILKKSDVIKITRKPKKKPASSKVERPALNKAEEGEEETKAKKPEGEKKSVKKKETKKEKEEKAEDKKKEKSQIKNTKSKTKPKTV